MLSRIKQEGISTNGLKWIAIIAMLIDHIAWKMELPASIFIAMHAIGRFTMPIMCFFIAEGFHHTRSRKKYVLRLLVFAIVSQIPFGYFMTGNIPHIWIGPGSLNVIFILMFGLCALWAIKSSLNKAVKAILVTLCIIGSVLCDWMIFGALWIIAFGLCNSFKQKAIWFSIITAGMMLTMGLPAAILGEWPQAAMLLGVFLPLPLLAKYNGKLSGDNAPAWTTNKWVFYAFYPIHLLILGYLHYGPGVLV